MKRLLLALLFLAPMPAVAALPTYTGNISVPSGATLTFGVGGTGCAIITAGVLAPASCPSGTAAFTAGTNISITGTNPYTISCPNCFQVGGGTITGATTFSAATTFNALPTSSVGITNSSTSVPITSGVAGSASAGFQLGAPTTGFAKLFTTSSAGCQAQVGTGLAISVNGTTVADIDASGNMGLCGILYTASKRAYKQDIHPLSLDALQVLHDTNFVSFRYKRPYGDPSQTHIGFIADDTPSILSGPKHDHFEAASLAVVEGEAILQLDQQVKMLTILLGLFGALSVALLFGVIGAYRRS